MNKKERIFAGCFLGVFIVIAVMCFAAHEYQYPLGLVFLVATTVALVILELKEETNDLVKNRREKIGYEKNIR